MKPRLTPEMLSPAMKAAFDLATGNEQSFDAILRRMK
jgi:hypothetical protein